MTTDKRHRLEDAGWRVGDAREFLELTPDEAEVVEIKLAQAAESAMSADRRRPQGSEAPASRGKKRSEATRKKLRGKVM
ncbi:MAG TPA: hypothetical protein VNI54_02240 [Thermoanaerobaculia bacterium]|nr:hypothetical protein [Thermoanaerobaculia bacterium]